ncbi:uncharacterized protein LOC120699203 isoform X2 [Panicum virgatum]|uniref:uncharacterized protein LOC120699203 isoform X2 n=1 Tax=Panicum virgatum TaxID=38727 RepID=UPI0019D6987D|nr:uncharacterized protein LOC120699203 isoform X2 [Panicum virgatum]
MREKIHLAGSYEEGSRSASLLSAWSSGLSGSSSSLSQPAAWSSWGRHAVETRATTGDSPEEFSVEVHHGGGFIGFGHLRLYVDGKVSWFDHCEADSWSKFWLDDMLEKLGYPETPNLKYYWLLPGKDLSDGLRIIIGDADTNVMCSVVDRIKNLVVYFDGLPRLDKTNLKSTKKNSTTGRVATHSEHTTYVKGCSIRATRSHKK